ncbi:MAG: PQQ-binding-like beta-propeller repeat protein [Acidobacteriota bacterium]
MSERTERKSHWLPPIKGRGRIVGRIVWLLLTLILGTIVWMQTSDAFGDHGMANAFSMMAATLLLIVWLLWFLLASGQRWWMRLVPVIALGLIGLGFNSLYRFEDVSGEFVPRFVPRSAEKPDRELAALATDGAGGVDLVTTSANDFPQFLGPNRNLAIDHIELARDWEAQPPKLVWRQPIGAGWGAFSVVNGYAVTMEQRGDDENVTCYDARTGEVQWSHTHAARYEVAIAGIGPRTTPTITGGMVYTQGALGQLLALDGATGRVVWEKDMLAEHAKSPEQETAALPYGRSGSPLIVDDLLIVPGGGPTDGKQVSLIAYDKNTGAKVWEGGDEQISCSSPAIATVGGVRQILIVNESSASGHDVTNGRVLWRHPREGKSNANANVSQAVAVGPNQVFLSKGYALGATLIELVAKGDGTFDTREIWQNSRVMRTKFTNVAIKDGYAYGLSDGILECIELATGERMWKGGRYKHGQILRVGDLLLVLAESGEVLLIEATPERKNHVLGRFQAIEGKSWNNLALYGSLLLVRNGEEAAAYELPLA